MSCASQLERYARAFYQHQEGLSRAALISTWRAPGEAHLVEGLQLAIDYIDEVITIIRQSADEETAKTSQRAIRAH